MKKKYERRIRKLQSDIKSLKIQRARLRRMNKQYKNLFNQELNITDVTIKPFSSFPRFSSMPLS